VMLYAQWWRFTNGSGMFNRFLTDADETEHDFVEPKLRLETI